MKTKTLIRFHIFLYRCRVLRALTKAKSMLRELVNESPQDNRDNRKDKEEKKLLSSIRVHYNWCSSHAQPKPEPEPAIDRSKASHGYHDSTQNSIFPAIEFKDGMELQQTSCLHGLEEKVPDYCMADEEVDEIDKLAAKFIASCHEKFRLEKQESYRGYQDMIARGL